MRTFGWLATLGLALTILAGCGGGGGGGGASADVQGVVYLISTTGNPVALQGASVSIGGGSAVTAADGSFILRGVSASAAQLSITATGIKPLTQPLPPLTAGHVNDLGGIYVLDATSTDGYTATVIGTVVRADTLAPVAGALVKISGQGVVTDASGAFTITKLPVGLGGTNPVGVITATGFEDKPIIIDPPTGASPPNNDIGPQLISPPVGGIPGAPSDIRGTISLQGQTDLSGTTVTLIDKGTGNVVGTQVTGTSGQYGFYVAAGTYTVQAVHAGFATKTQDVTLVRPDLAQDVNITLTP